MSFSIIYITFPDEASARTLSNHLVKERYAACANTFPIQSSYWWKDDIEVGKEWVAILKTTNNKWPSLEKVVEELHSYKVPCITRWEATANQAYEDWIKQEVS